MQRVYSYQNFVCLASQDGFDENAGLEIGIAKVKNSDSVQELDIIYFGTLYYRGFTHIELVNKQYYPIVKHFETFLLDNPPFKRSSDYDY